MPESDKQFTGSIPDIYDGYLVPLIFEPYAEDLARRIAAFQPRDILETAAGTGAVTRAMARRMPQARILATDLNPPMLERAGKRQPPGPVTRQPADAQALPFADASFDVVACQFGVMFFPDKPKAHSEARRVLRGGGRLVFNAWDRLEANEFAAVVTEALNDFFPGNPIRFVERVPHGYFDEGQIRADLAAGGFHDVTVERVAFMAQGASAREVAVAYCQGTPMRNEIEARDGSRLEEATMRAASALEKRFGAGAIEGGIAAWVITAR